MWMWGSKRSTRCSATAHHTVGGGAEARRGAWHEDPGGRGSQVGRRCRSRRRSPTPASHPPIAELLRFLPQTSGLHLVLDGQVKREGGLEDKLLSLQVSDVTLRGALSL